MHMFHLPSPELFGLQRRHWGGRKIVRETTVETDWLYVDPEDFSVPFLLGSQGDGVEMLRYSAGVWMFAFSELTSLSKGVALGFARAGTRLLSFLVVMIRFKAFSVAPP